MVERIPEEETPGTTGGVPVTQQGSGSGSSSSVVEPTNGGNGSSKWCFVGVGGFTWAVVNIQMTDARSRPTTFRYY